MTSEALKPCPFCGSPAVLSQASNDPAWWIIRCSDQADDAAMACRACPEVQEDNRELAIVHWNHREPSRPPHGESEGGEVKLEKALHVAADEFVQLEAQRDWLQTQFDDAYSDLERYAAALRSIADNTCCGECQEAARVAQAALIAPDCSGAGTLEATVARLTAELKRVEAERDTAWDVANGQRRMTVQVADERDSARSELAQVRQQMEAGREALRRIAISAPADPAKRWLSYDEIGAIADAALAKAEVKA